MAVPESQDGLEHKVQAAREMIHNLCSPRFAAEHREWEMSIPARPDYDPDLVIADAIRVLEAQLIATRAELRDLKLAASLACELHGCASAGCTMAQYHQDVQKLLADLAAKDAELREARKLIPADRVCQMIDDFPNILPEVAQVMKASIRNGQCPHAVRVSLKLVPVTAYQSTDRQIY